MIISILTQWLDTLVVRPAPISGHRDDGGISVGRTLIAGQQAYTLTVRHSDGRMLTALLCDDTLDQLAQMMANEVTAVPLSAIPANEGGAR